MKKLVSLCLIGMLTVSLLTGCGNKNAEDNGNVVNITILNSKPEILSELENIAEKFESDNKDIKIKLVKYSQSASYREKLGAMSAMNNAPTLTLVDAADISKYSDNCLSLSDETWIKDIKGEVADIAKNENGEIIAFPFAIEGAGFIYNKKVIDEAKIDIGSINTISELEEAFKKVNGIGKEALVITNEDWSLGDHFLATFYAAEIENAGVDTKTYFDKLRNSSEDIIKNKYLNGLLDTFDLMKEYNIYKDSPLAPSYEKCSELIGSGEVGFWYNGNWASKNILDKSNGNSEFGFIAVPMSNNSSDHMNNKIAIGITKYLVINNNASQSQINAAKRFLNYIVYSEEGNKFISEDAGVIPAFSNISVLQKDPLVNEIIRYRDEDNTIELMNSYLPSDNSKVLGLSLRKYLNNEITREVLVRNISDFWKNH